MIFVENLFTDEQLQDIKEELKGRRNVTFVFRGSGGHFDKILEIAELIQKIPETKALALNASSGPFFLALMCKKRFALKNANLVAHTGCIKIEEIDLIDGEKIPKRILKDLENYKTQLFLRLEELGLGSEDISMLRHTGKLNAPAPWWFKKGIFRPDDEMI